MSPTFSWVSLLSIVQKLIANGPAAVSILLDVLSTFQSAIAKLEDLAKLVGITAPAPATPAPVALSVEAQAAEDAARDQVLALLKPTHQFQAQALFGGDFAGKLGAFLKAHPEIWQAIIGKLAGVLLGS